MNGWIFISIGIIAILVFVGIIVTMIVWKKKKFGETIKSRNRVAQENELLCKIIAYNITVLIHEMIGLDNISEFLSFTGLTKEVSINQHDNGF